MQPSAVQALASLFSYEKLKICYCQAIDTSAIAHGPHPPAFCQASKSLAEDPGHGQGSVSTACGASGRDRLHNGAQRPQETPKLNGRELSHGLSEITSCPDFGARHKATQKKPHDLHVSASTKLRFSAPTQAMLRDNSQHCC